MEKPVMLVIGGGPEGGNPDNWLPFANGNAEPGFKGAAAAPALSAAADLLLL